MADVVSGSAVDGDVRQSSDELLLRTASPEGRGL